MSQAYRLDEERLCAGADFERGIPCNQSEERQDVRTEMVPVSITNSLTARDSQHPHNASAGADRRDTVDEAGAFISTPSQSCRLPAPIILVGK